MTTKETIDHLISDRESGKAVYGAQNKGRETRPWLHSAGSSEGP